MVIKNLFKEEASWGHILLDGVAGAIVILSFYR